MLASTHAPPNPLQTMATPSESTRYFAVLSEQRSSSTALHQAIAHAGGTCLLAIGEPFHNPAPAGGLLKWAWSASLSRDAVINRRQKPLQFLKNVHHKACAASNCKAHTCGLVFKLFDTHRVGKAALQELVSSPMTMAIVLRRSRIDAKCSREFALSHTHWATAPQFRSHKMQADYDTFKAACKSRGLSEYERSTFHPISRWRDIVDVTSAKANHVNVTFENVTHNLDATALGVLRLASFSPHRGKAACNPLVSECALSSPNFSFALHNTSVPLAHHEHEDSGVDFDAPKRKRPPVTVCIVTMVTDETPTLRLWVYHHVYSLGIKQIRAYYTHKPSILQVPRIVGVRFWPMSVATKHVNLTLPNSSMFLSHKSCSYCCATHSKPSSVKGMCERPVYMPEQALTLRHAASTSSAVWIAAIDVDEYLVGNGRWPQSLLHVMHRVSTRGQSPPGGFKITQIQMLAESVWLNDTRRALRPRPSRWQHQKCIVRRDALHPNPRAFGAIHEITLRQGQQYHQINVAQAALLHYRYVNWKKRKQTRIEGLHCHSDLQNENRQRICAVKMQEMRMWENALLQSHKAQQVIVAAGRVPHDQGLVFVPQGNKSVV